MKMRRTHDLTRLGLLAATIALAPSLIGSTAGQEVPAELASSSTEAETPPVIRTGVVGIELRERGALLVDDFEGDEIDTSKWRIWNSDAGKAQLDVQDGRFEIRAKSGMGHNGLWSLDATRFKDVTLVARMNIQSEGDSPHDLLLHLCGGDAPTSPDHWIEISMRDIGDGKARFAVDAGVEKGVFTERHKELVLDRGTDEGFLARLSLDGSSNLCTTEVRDRDGEWHEIAEPIPLRLRTTHGEIKMRGGWMRKRGDRRSSSVGWFKSVRMYPRAKAHPVLLRLVKRDGSAIYFRENGAWPPRIRVGDEEPKVLEDLAVELWTADGETLISRTQSSFSQGHYMLPVDHDTWDVFPVGALVRVSIGDRSLGEARIPLDRLYPDDVYDVFME